MVGEVVSIQPISNELGLLGSLDPGNSILNAGVLRHSLAAVRPKDSGITANG